MRIVTNFNFIYLERMQLIGLHCRCTSHGGSKVRQINWLHKAVQFYKMATLKKYWFSIYSDFWLTLCVFIRDVYCVYLSRLGAEWNFITQKTQRISDSFAWPKCRQGASFQSQRKLFLAIGLKYSALSLVLPSKFIFYSQYDFQH